MLADRSEGAIGGQRVRERKIGRIGLSRHVGVAWASTAMPLPCVTAAAAQVSGVGQGERGGPVVKAQLADEGISDAARRTLLVAQRVRQRKIGRIGLSRHVGVAAGIHRDADGLRQSCCRPSKWSRSG